MLAPITALARRSVRSYGATTGAAPSFQFKCTACGKCCTGKGGRVRVNAREIEELGQTLRVPTMEVKHKFLVESQEADAWLIRQTADDKQCIFLDGKRCSVYEARPTQCRTYPWWPQHLISEYDWRLAARECEGIRFDEGDGGETVRTLHDVLPEAVVYDIHRSGENYTYDELHQLLRDLRDVDPGFLDEYAKELSEKFMRKVVHQNESVTVLDTFLDGAAPTRCFVFNDRLHLVQSEMRLAEDGQSVDPSELVLDVHGAMCGPLAWLRQQRDRVWDVAIIGAGGGSLVRYVLHHHSANCNHVDAVEPDAQVNAIAQRFFGVDYEGDSKLRLHEVFGEQFVAQQHQDPCNLGKYDLLLIDVEAGEAIDGVTAPPQSMLTVQFLQQVGDLLSDDGLCVVNVITEDETALHQVMNRVGDQFDGLMQRLPKNTVLFLFKKSWAKDKKDSIRQSFTAGTRVEELLGRK